MASCHGLEPTLDMTLNQLFAIFKLKVRRDNLQLISQATAFRAAQSDSDNFTKYVKDLGG
ncbi:hypothetical protein [Vibrio phage vB_VhaS-a]|nr:hypothetical protein [Vibrio phage vB_VhaS-a]